MVCTRKKWSDERREVVCGKVCAPVGARDERAALPREGQMYSARARVTSLVHTTCVHRATGLF